MSLLLLMVAYVVPALFILLAIGAVWSLLRLAPLGRPARIALFVLLMTAGLAPMLGPATIVVACCVPNGLFLLLDAAGLVSWYLHTYQWSLASLAGTGALAFLVAYWRIKPNDDPPRPGLVRLALPLAALAFCYLAFDAFFPNAGDLSPSISQTSIERAYRDLFAEAAQTLELEGDAREAAVASLKAELAKRREFISFHVTGPDPKAEAPAPGRAFGYKRDGYRAGGWSCHGSGQNLMRCAVDYGGWFELDVVRHSRDYTWQGKQRQIHINFDHDALEEALPH